MFYFAEAALNTHSCYVPSHNIQNIVSVSRYILLIYTLNTSQRMANWEFIFVAVCDLRMT